jgi:hypothetical protein
LSPARSIAADERSEILEQLRNLEDFNRSAKDFRITTTKRDFKSEGTHRTLSFLTDEGALDFRFIWNTEYAASVKFDASGEASLISLSQRVGEHTGRYFPYSGVLHLPASLIEIADRMDEKAVDKSDPRKNVVHLVGNRSSEEIVPLREFKFYWDSIDKRISGYEFPLNAEVSRIVYWDAYDKFGNYVLPSKFRSVSSSAKAQIVISDTEWKYSSEPALNQEECYLKHYELPEPNFVAAESDSAFSTSTIVIALGTIALISGGLAWGWMRK